jgi:hypothetical protein
MCRRLHDTRRLVASIKPTQKRLNGDAPYLDRLEFIEGLAALAALYPEEMVKRATSPSPKPNFLFCLVGQSRSSVHASIPQVTLP